MSLLSIGVFSCIQGLRLAEGVLRVTYRSRVGAVEAINIACIRINYLHHTPWGAALPQTLLSQDALCMGCPFILCQHMDTCSIMLTFMSFLSYGVP